LFIWIVLFGEKQTISGFTLAETVTYMIGVTDMTFNPVLAVYGRRLFTKDGHRITPDYWNQKDDGKNEFNPNYWDYHKKPWFGAETGE